MVATAPPEGPLASETEPPWALAASEAAWRPSPNWIGNTYLDDSGRDSPASLNSTGDM